MYTEVDDREILEIFFLCSKTFEIEVVEFCSTRLATFKIKKKSRSFRSSAVAVNFEIFNFMNIMVRLIV